MSRIPALCCSAALGMALVSLGACSSSEERGPAPPGWDLVYAQDFEGDELALDFVASDPSAWRIAEEDGCQVFICAAGMAAHLAGAVVAPDESIMLTCYGELLAQEGKHHFSAIEGLNDPGSTLCKAVTDFMARCEKNQ